MDLSRFPALTYFKDTDTQLKQVSFRNNPRLRIVTFLKKPLASLNVSNNTASGRLGYSGNQLTTRMQPS